MSALVFIFFSSVAVSSPVFVFRRSLGLYLHMSKPHQSCFPTPLCDVLYPQSLPPPPMLSFLTWSLCYRQCHLHTFINAQYGLVPFSVLKLKIEDLCHFQSVHMGASHWHCLYTIHLSRPCQYLPYRVVVFSCHIGR